MTLFLAASEQIQAFSEGGGFMTQAFRFVMTAVLSTLIIWLVVRILKKDD